MKKRFLGILCAAVMTLGSLPAAPVSAADQSDTGVTSDGYNYELWNQDYQGAAQWQLGKNGTYSCSWSNIKNVLFRTGKKFSDYPQWNTLNGIYVDYTCSEYAPNGNSYLCVYGWTKNPLVEYYIVENYGSWRPPGESASMKKVGEITVDGGTYEVYKGTHDGPSIENGVTHFNQYWSVRKDGQLRTSGVINVGAHFKAWEEQFGMTMGGLYEVALNVEGYMSSGSATISKNDLYLGKEPDGTAGSDDPVVDPEPAVSYTAPTGSGTGVTDDFEGTGTDWSGRGNVKYGFTKDFVYSGNQSLYVTNRTDSWNGLTVASDELKAGTSYEISAFATYNNENVFNQSFTLGLQYDLNGDTHYDNLVDSDTVSGVWTELATGFDIPAGAENISLYVQTAYTETATDKDKISFYLDDVRLTDLSTVTTTEMTTTTSETSNVSGNTTFPNTVTTVSSTTQTTTTTVTTKAGMRGDVDNNGSVEIMDAIMLARIVSEDQTVKVTEQGLRNAEIDGIEGIDVNDLTTLLIMLASGTTAIE